MTMSLRHSGIILIGCASLLYAGGRDDGVKEYNQDVRPDAKAFYRMPLRDVQGFSVVTEEVVNPQLVAIGIDQEFLRRKIEAALRSNGMRIVPLDRNGGTVPMLGLKLLAVDASGPNSGVAVAVNLNVSEPVRLLRDPEILAMASIWHEDVTGFFGSNRLNDCAQGVDYLLKRLLADCAAAKRDEAQARR